MPFRRFFAKDGQQHPSLYGGILQWMLIPLVLLWLVTMGIEYLLSLSIANAAYDRELEHALSYLNRQVAFGPGRPVLKAFGSADLVALADEDGDLLYQLRGPRDELIAGSARLPPPRHAGEFDLQTAYFRDEMVRGERLRIAYQFVRAQGRDELYSLQVAAGYERRVLLAFAMTGGQLSVQLLIVPIALTLVWLGIAKGMEPLDALISRVRAREPHNLAPLDPRDAPEEVRAFIHSINDLMARLEQSMRAQQLFVADAAHQLRTPIAGLKTQAELALRQRDEVGIEHTMRQIAAAADRASRLITQLLALARADSNAPAPQEAVNLAALARGTMPDWVPRALDHGIELGFDAPDAPCLVNGNVVLLRELLNNLLDNAIRYTAANGQVTVRVVNSARVALEVEDNGVGIAPADRERVFDRFYRVLDNGAEGTGLGLAIVRAICNVHQAEVSLRQGRDGQGTLVRVEFQRFDSQRKELLRRAA